MWLGSTTAAPPQVEIGAAYRSSVRGGGHKRIWRPNQFIIRRLVADADGRTLPLYLRANFRFLSSPSHLNVVPGLLFSSYFFFVYMTFLRFIGGGGGDDDDDGDFKSKTTAATVHCHHHRQVRKREHVVSCGLAFTFLFCFLCCVCVL